MMRIVWRRIEEHFRRMALAYLVFVFTLVLTWAWGDYFERLLNEGTKYLPIKNIGGAGLALSIIMFGLMWTQINARSKAERLTEDLRQSRERDRLVQMATHDIIRDWDLVTDRMQWNEAIHHLFGYSKKELKPTGDWWKDRLHSEDRGRVIAGLEKALAGKAEAWSDEYRFRRTNGTFASVIDRGYIVRDEQGAARRMIASLMDISDRKRAEAALADEKERLAVTLSSIAEGVITTDVKGNVLLLNRVAEAMTGWSTAEAAGKPLADIFQPLDPASRERRPHPVEGVLQSGALSGEADDVVLVGRDNSERIISAIAAPIRDTTGRLSGAVLVFRDVTRKHHEAEELLKASKLESLGILASGVAHDLGNIVTAIIGNLSLTRMYANPNEKAAQKLEEAQKAALRAKTLIQQLSTFAKGGAVTKSTLSLTELIRENITLAADNTSIRVELDLAPDLWPVEIDSAQFILVLANLVNHAQQAMPEGGVLEVQARNFHLDADTKISLPEGHYVRVRLTDHSDGIRPEHIKRIFDPYFVNEDKRSGLGLATAYAIIKKHVGLLTVESTMGKGTSFFIYLPISPEAAARAVTPAPDAEAVPGGKGRILVVDDEESIRLIASELLRELGYDVALAESGQQALDEYRAALNNHQPFDLVILDLSLGSGLSGKETMQHLLKMHPETKVIVSSGYAEDPAVVKYQNYGFAGAVIKPYRLEELATVIYELVGHAKF